MSSAVLRHWAGRTLVPLLGAGGVLLLFLRRPQPGDLVRVGMLTLLFALAEFFVIRFRGGVTTLSFPIAFAAFHLFGGAPAVWVPAVGAFATTLVRRKPLGAAFINLGFCAASATVAAWAATGMQHLHALAEPGLWHALAGLVVYSQAFYWVNVLLSEGLIWLRHGRSTRDRWFIHIRLQLATHGISSGYCLLFLLGMRSYDLLHLGVLFVPLAIGGALWHTSHALRESRGRQSFLFEMASHCTAAHSLPDTACQILERLQQVIPHDHAVLLLRGSPVSEAGEEVLRVVALCTAGLERPVKAVRIRRGPIWRVLRSGKPERFDDIQLEKAWSPPRHLAHVKACLLVPVLIGDDVRGVIGLGSHLSDAFFPEDLQMVAVLSNQLGQVIQNLEILQRGEQIAVTEERNRLGRELHDGLAQQLAGVILRLEHLDRGTLDMRPELDQEIREVRESLRGSLRELRRAIHDLRPAPLQNQPFLPAVRRVALEFGQETALEVNFALHGRVRPLRPGVEDGLFQVLTEALNNSGKHARARRVQVTLRFSLRGLRLVVQDDGEGFELLPALLGSRAGERVGIIGMHERVKAMHGRLVIDTKPGSGTRIEVDVPYVRPEGISRVEVG